MENAIGLFGLSARMFRHGCWNLQAVPRPVVHELSPLLKEVAPAVGSFGLIFHSVRERSLSDIAGMAGLFADPVPKC